MWGRGRGERTRRRPGSSSARGGHLRIRATHDLEGYGLLAVGASSIDKGDLEEATIAEPWTSRPRLARGGWNWIGREVPAWLRREDRAAEGADEDFRDHSVDLLLQQGEHQLAHLPRARSWPISSRKRPRRRTSSSQPEKWRRGAHGPREPQAKGFDHSSLSFLGERAHGQVL